MLPIHERVMDIMRGDQMEGNLDLNDEGCFDDLTLW